MLSLLNDIAVPFGVDSRCQGLFGSYLEVLL
jgi:hypothetical protein